MLTAGQRIGIVTSNASRAVLRESFVQPVDNVSIGMVGTGSKPRITGLAALSGSWAQVSADRIISQFTATSFISINLGNISGQIIQGTEYTVGSSALSISKLVFLVYMNGTIASGNLLATVYDNTSGTPTTKLGTSGSVDATTITTSTAGQAVTFTFATPVSLAAGAKVVLCLEKTFTTSSSNYIHLIGGPPNAQFPARWRNSPWQKFTDEVPYIQVITNTATAWQKSVATQPRVVMFDDAYGNQQTTTLSQNLDWMWSGGTLTVYGVTAPNTIWSVIEVGARYTVVDTNGKQRLTLSDLRIDGGNGYGVYFSGNSGYHSLQRCDVWNNFNIGIVPQPSGFAHPSVTISNCTTQRNGAFGIVVGQGVTDWVVSHQTSYRDGYVAASFDDGSQINAFGGGIGLQMFTDTIHARNTITDCQVSYTGVRDDGTNTGINKGFGIWADTARPTSLADADVVQRCVSHHNNSAGLFNEKSRYVIWRSCVSYANGQHGMRVDAEAGPVGATNQEAVEHCYFYNLTLYGNGGDGLYSRGGYLQDGSGGETAHDLTFANIISTGNVGHDFYVRDGADNTPGLGSNNTYSNMYFGPDRTAFFGWKQVDYNTLAAVSAASISAVTGLLASSPLLNNPASADFTLQAGSPARGAGITIPTVTTDVTGAPFTTPTLGAYA